MANRFKIRRGSSIPTIDKLENFELGYCTSDGLLYINKGGQIVSIGTKLTQIITDSQHSADFAISADAVYNFVNNNYVKKTDFIGKYLPLTGGKLTGDLSFSADHDSKYEGYTTEDGTHIVSMGAWATNSSSNGVFYIGIETEGILNTRLYGGYSGNIYYQYGGAPNQSYEQNQAILLHSLNYQTHLNSTYARLKSANDLLSRTDEFIFANNRTGDIFINFRDNSITEYKFMTGAGTHNGYADIGMKTCKVYYPSNVSISSQIYHANSSWLHFYTSAPSGFWFSENIAVSGEIYAGNDYNKKVWHEGNLTFQTS